MIRFVHSADWQLGARFAQFGAQAGALRAARLQTLRRALGLAQSRRADAFLVAGDLFEDNQVAESLVDGVVQICSEFAPLPIFLLPGNHDPISGPECVWRRNAWQRVASHVRILDRVEAIDLGGAWLLASPLAQKVSTLDPSLPLIALARELPADAIKVGLTHGAPAIEGKHQLNDFPIALEAASRAGLDYLGLGHWHGWMAGIDGGRVVMPGTPEPDRFGQEHSGGVAWVEIDAAGALPRVEALPVATLGWREIHGDFVEGISARDSLALAVETLLPHATQTVLRVILRGSASPSLRAETRGWLDLALEPFLCAQVLDHSTLSLRDPELRDLQARHPLLAQVLADLDSLEGLASGKDTALPAAAAPLALGEAEAILNPAKIELTALTPAHFAQARQLLLQTLQEVAR